jgi:hypothetical protein
VLVVCVLIGRAEKSERETQNYRSFVLTKCLLFFFK